jgi:hypothetical protein
MKKLLFAYCMMVAILSAQQATVEYESEREILETTLFQNNDTEVTNVCEARCRVVSKDGYTTQITHFDAKTGITSCGVYRKSGLENSIQFTADTINRKCIELTNQNVTYGSGQLKSEGQEDNFKRLSSIAYQDTKLSFSRMMTGLVTLDPEIVNFQETNLTGLIAYTHEGDVYGASITGLDRLSSGKEAQYVATVDSLNKANLAYYANLYLSWGEVYSYLQNYIFVLITGFFLIRIGYTKILEKLERSRSEDSKWLAKLMTPLVAVSFFFAPIPESEGLMSATVVQKMIRYFVQEGNAIADRASAIGTNVYMQKLYSSVGAMSAEGEKIIREAVLNGEQQVQIYEKELNSKCKERFPSAPTFQVTPEEEAGITQLDPNQKGYEGLITFGACRAIEQNWLLQNTLLRQNKIILDQIEISYGSGGSNLKTELTKFNALMQNRQNELGWVQSTMIASAAILVESLPLVKENSVADRLKKSNQEMVKQNQDELKENFGGKSKGSFWDNIKDGLQGVAGTLVGFTAYFMLPGADSLKNSVKEILNKASWISTTVVAMLTTPFGGVMATIFSGIAAEIGAIVVTIIIIKRFLSNIPIVVASVAAMLAFIGYIVELAKYFYISPFIVAYAMTTRNISKIMDFLSTGLIIFFKPTLIVIFIYFAIFMHSLIFDVFMTLTTEQFGVLKNLDTNFMLGLNVALFEVMLEIIASLGAIYVMWKLILTGPAWTVSLLGLKNTDNIMSNIENKLETKSFSM